MFPAFLFYFNTLSKLQLHNTLMLCRGNMILVLYIKH